MKHLLKYLGIFGIFLTILIVAVGIYFTRISDNYRIFRVGGAGVDSLQAGAIVIVSRNFNRPLAKGDLIIYQQAAGQKTISVLAVVRGLPGEGRVPVGSYLIERSNADKELIREPDIDWRVVKKIW